MEGSVWVASYVLLWLTVLGLAAAVVALLRQIGVLHARLHSLEQVEELVDEPRARAADADTGSHERAGPERPG